MIADELKYRIRDTFGHVPTAEQEQAIETFSMFMTDRLEHAVMVMRGCAGTGKTTLAAATAGAMGAVTVLAGSESVDGTGTDEISLAGLKLS